MGTSDTTDIVLECSKEKVFKNWIHGSWKICTDSTNTNIGLFLICSYRSGYQILVWLKLSLLNVSQCWPETAGLFGQDTVEEVQDPDSGWGYGCGRHGDGWPYPENHPDRVQW